MNTNKIRSFIKEHKIILLEALIIAVIFILTLIQNFMTQFTSDDWSYTFIYDNFGYPEGEVYRVQTPLDLLISTKNHWLQWNGRMINHLLLQIVLMTTYPGPFHKVFFNIINSVVYVLLGLMIYWHATYNKEKKLHLPLLLFGIYVMMWFFIPSYGMTVLWASGAANYLWSTVLLLAYLMPYRKYAVNHENTMRDSTKNMILMFLFGIAAGWTNENTGCAVAFMCMLFIGYFKLNKIHIPKWSIAGIIGNIIGFIFLIASPGNRRENSITKIESQSLDTYLQQFQKIIDISGDLFFGLLIILILILFTVLILNNKNRAYGTKDFLLTAILILGAIASVGVLFISDRAPMRSWFFAICMLIITVSYWFIKIDFSRIPKNLIIYGTVALIAMFTISLDSAYDSIYSTYLQTSAKQDAIYEAMETGKKRIRVKQVEPAKNTHDIAYNRSPVRMTEDPKAWTNIWPAKYFGVGDIIAE